MKTKTTRTTRQGAAARRLSAAPEKKAVEIKPAKGRPMLTWVGKRPLRYVPAYPAQLIETFSAHPSPDEHPERSRAAAQSKGPSEVGLLFHGDNKDVLAHLLANGYRGKVNLVYIDPPFDSGADYVRKVQLRGMAGTAKLDGETYTLGEQIQYTDIWANDNYLQFIYERLLLLRELLSPRGFLFLHSNPDRCHYLKCLLDEVFGSGGFKNQIIWKRTAAHGDTHGIGNVHDIVLAYSADPEATLANLYIPYDPDYVTSHYTQTESDGRRFQLVDLTAPGPRPGLMYEFHGIWPPPGRVWTMLPDKMEALFVSGRIVFTSEGKPRKKQYLENMPGMPVHDVWVDIFPVNSQAKEASGYPTQKSESLLERIMKLASNPGDLVLDCFIGSGTTAAVAQKLGRRWIGCDINKGAIQTTAKRLMGIMEEQARATRPVTPTLPGMEAGEDKTPPPAQLAFAVHRVNDYDLNVQHNEAVNLACEHLGITRTKTDSFFDGALGKRLAKIVPFNHPLTPLDLEEVKRELSARPEETRDIAVVCLGKETAVEAWLEEWNRLRKRGDVPNKIEVIELRSDPRYGGFFQHQPARAKVSLKRAKDKIKVEIIDFVSPSILERLKTQAGLLTPQINEWRAMVDSVLIDTAHDGQTFNITLADVPEKKTDLVAGEYELDAPAGKSTVAVKITDMLGEEVLVSKTV